jgi:hypothetical protein
VNFVGVDCKRELLTEVLPALAYRSDTLSFRIRAHLDKHKEADRE